MMSSAIPSARDLILRSGFVFVSTLQDADGFPETRVMFNLLNHRSDVLQDGPAALPSVFHSWLGTNTSSQKMRHIRGDPRACLYYADTTTFEGLSLQGSVQEVLDPVVRAAIWTDAWERYYPGGRDGGDFSLLLFTPLRGRYYRGLQVVSLDVQQIS